VGLSKERYFKCGDVTDLKEKIEYHLDKPVTVDEKSVFRALIRKKYNWEKIAVQTVKVYEKPWPNNKGQAWLDQLSLGFLLKKNTIEAIFKNISTLD
jgi:hypothetical protein